MGDAALAGQFTNGDYFTIVVNNTDGIKWFQNGSQFTFSNQSIGITGFSAGFIINNANDYIDDISFGYLPSGSIGPTGYTGYTGYTGTIGVTGSTGPTGGIYNYLNDNMLFTQNLNIGNMIVQTGALINGSVNIYKNTNSTSSTTGALVINGNVDLLQDLNISTKITSDGTTINTNATLSTIGNMVYVNGTEESTSITTGAVSIIGGAGITGNIYVGGDLRYSNTINKIPLEFELEINQDAYTNTLKKNSIYYPNTVSISSSNIIATIDNSSTNQQIYTFGSTIQNRYVIGASGGINTLAYSNDGFNWIGLGTNTFTTSCNAVAWNGVMWVAVGQGNNSIAYSYDGINWTGASSILSQGNGIAWNGMMWVAVGSGTNSIVFSYDGIIWNTCNLMADAPLYGIAWNGIMWIAVASVSGQSVGYIYYSYDGINWDNTDYNLEIECRGIAWNGIMWVVVGGGTDLPGSLTASIYSYDGINWNYGSGLGASESYNVSWNGNMWIAVSDGNVLYYSYDGINWTFTINRGNIDRAYGIIWNGNMWLTVGGIVTDISIAYSYDGINWTGISDTMDIVENGQTIAFNNLRQNTITFPSNKSIITNGSNILYSQNGTTWTNAIMSGITGSYSYNTSYYNGTIWLAGGTGSVHAMAYSYNGINWNGIYGSIAIFTTQCNQITWGNSMWLAVGSGTNTIAYSYDGFTWTGLGLSILTLGNCIAYNGTLWIAGGSGATYTVSYSYDGKTWIGATSTFSQCNGFAWNGIMWIAVGATSSGNAIQYSYDGINWNNSNNTILSTGNSVAWNGNLWVAGGTGATYAIVYSSDGINWNNYILGSGIGSFAIIDLNWIGTRWIAVRGSQSGLFSYDGINWSLVGYNGYSISWSGNQKGSVYIQQPIIAGGTGNNTLAYSSDGNNWIGLGTNVFSSCSAIGWNGTTWLASGTSISDDIIATSYDGINWSTYPNRNYVSIYWNGTQWICGGNYGIIGYFDKYGKFIGDLTIDNYLQQINDITSNNNYTVYVGSVSIIPSSTIVYSDINNIFTSVQSSFFTQANGITCNSQYFVAVGQSGSSSVAYASVASPSTWNFVINSPFTIGNGIAYNGIMFVAVGSGSNSIAYSNDGLTWTSVNGSNLIFNEGKKVVWTGKKWIAVGIPNITNGYSMAYSYNGKDWFGVPNYLKTTSPTPIFSSGISGCSNSQIGSVIVDSVLTISDKNNPNTKTLDIVSGSYYDSTFTNLNIIVFK
jgi:hypothetical protein